MKIRNILGLSLLFAALAAPVASSAQRVFTRGSQSGGYRNGSSHPGYSNRGNANGPVRIGGATYYFGNGCGVGGYAPPVYYYQAPVPYYGFPYGYNPYYRSYPSYGYGLYRGY